MLDTKTKLTKLMHSEHKSCLDYSNTMKKRLNTIACDLSENKIPSMLNVIAISNKNHKKRCDNIIKKINTIVK